MMSTTTDVDYTEKNGTITIASDGDPAGKMTFVFAGADTIIIDHTEVDEAYNGKGFGKILFENAVAFAREKNLKVVPLCPFAKRMFDKMPETRDVLK